MPGSVVSGITAERLCSGYAVNRPDSKKAEGKTDAVCYDYVDAIQFCENQFKRRKTHYRKAGCIL